MKNPLMIFKLGASSFLVANLLLPIVSTNGHALAQSQTGTTLTQPAGTMQGGMEPSNPSESAVAAEESDAKQKDADKGPERISAGVIASYGTFPKASAVNALNQSDIPGDKASPVSGSVSRQGETCLVTVSNQSEKDGYSVSFEVVGYRGSSRAFSKYFSARLDPKGSTQKSISGCDRDVNVQVVVKSGRRIGK